MEDPELLEWIDEYLLGTIQPDHRALLEARMSSDPGIADLVRHSREAFLAIQVAREHQLRDKMVEWDQKVALRKTKLRRIWTWVFVCISFFLIVLLSLSYIYAPEKLASRYSTSVPSPDSHSFSSTEQVAWNRAHQEMMKGHFTQAKEIFSAFIQHADQQIQQSATWQTLLCDLGATGSSSGWQVRLHEFIQQADDPYKIPALELKAITNSFFFKTILQRISPYHMTYLKPSII